MSNPNGILLPFVLFLVYTTLFSPKCIVSAEEPNFKRPDPLRHFHYYRGSYDVRNKHYWAVSYIASWGGHILFILAFLCFVFCEDRTHIINVTEYIGVPTPKQMSNFFGAVNHYVIRKIETFSVLIIIMWG